MISLHENRGEEIVRPIRDLEKRLDVRQEGKTVVVDVVVSGPRRNSILETPGPWSKEFLEAHGLRVLYTHGRAVLSFKA